MDIRVRSTKAAVRNALIELMGQEQYEKITISHLCETAEISRKTFYLHYNSLDEVIKDIGNELYVQFSEKFKSHDGTDYEMRNLVHDLNRIIIENMNHYSKMATSASHHEFHMALEIAFQKIVADVCKSTYQITSPNLDYYASFYASGLISVYGNWLRNNPNGSLQDLERIITRCCFLGADQFINDVRKMKSL